MNIEEEIARAIGENFQACRGRNGVSRTELAAALIPLVKRAQAVALREAAKDLVEHFQDIPAWVEAYREGERTDEWMRGGVRMTMSAIDVLRARADRIEQNSEGDEGE